MTPKHTEYPYIEYIYWRLIQDNITPTLSRGLLSLVFKYFLEYVAHELLHERDVPVYGMGKFRVIKRAVPDNETTRRRYPDGEIPAFQYFIRFRASANWTRRYRSHKGTSSVSELRALQEKDAWMADQLQTSEMEAALKGGFFTDALEERRKQFKNRVAQFEKLKKQVEGETNK